MKSKSIQSLCPATATIRKRKNSITSLPKELLVDVLAVVASESVTDLINAKLSCKDLCQASNDDVVFAHASLDKFHIPPWFLSDKASSFLERCKENGNPEFLFRQGMFEYFSLGRTESGMRQLKRAADMGHLESTYVYSIILICSGSSTELKQQGLKLLSSSKSTFRTREFRENIRRKIPRMWWSHNIIMQQEDHSNAANSCKCLENWRRGWSRDDDFVACSDACLCHILIAFFCDLVR